jgi:hypothetical protein
MKIRLDKEMILKLYSYTFQGERSIAFALGAPWPELLDYYRGRRLEKLKRFTDYFLDQTLHQGIAGPPLRGKELARYAPSYGIFQYFFGKWVSQWKRRWPFYPQMICFMASALQSLVKTLETEARPDQQALIDLRIDLCLSRSAIEDRCYGLPALEVARRIEHFWQADWRMPLTLEEILEQSPVREVPPTKKIA